MRVWVTGAGGFVGSHLVPRLLAAGVEVTPTDDDLDVADPGAVAPAMRRLEPDAVVHLAALSSVAASIQDASGAWRVNFLGTRTLLAAAEEFAPKARLLLVGSGDVYGSGQPGSPPFDERAPLRPRSPYGWTKACADLLGASYAERGLPVVRARPFNHTGPGQGTAFVASSFAQQIAEMEAGRREPVMRVGNLDSVRDFLDVGDVVDAYLRLLDPAVAPGPYNVAGGRGIPVKSLLDGLLAHARVEPRIEVDPERMRPTDVSVGSSRRLRRATGWQPVRPLADTLGRLLDAWRERLAAG